MNLQRRCAPSPTTYLRQSGDAVPIKIIKKTKSLPQQGHVPIPYSLKLLKGMGAIKSANAPNSSSKPKLVGPAKVGTKSLRQDKSERHDRLRKLIFQTIDGSLPGGITLEFEGFVWAFRPVPEWAKLLGVKSADTISDLIKIPPIQKAYTRVDGKKALLLRVGPPGIPTPRVIANFMKSAFRAKTGRYPKKELFPLLKVLAEEWPDGLQVEIFKAVLDDWVAFKAGVAIEVEQMKAEGQKARHCYHEYPSVSVICRFRHVALELYVMRLQEKVVQGKPIPPAAIAAFPKIFGHLQPK